MLMGMQMDSKKGIPERIPKQKQIIICLKYAMRIYVISAPIRNVKVGAGGIDSWQEKSVMIYDRHGNEVILDSHRKIMPLFTTNMDELMQCVNCGKFIKYGDGYTSKRYFSGMGFGYLECKECYFKYDEVNDD